MKYLTKALLIISVAAFAASLTSIGTNVHCGMLKPPSAILFVVFFILHVTQKEVALFDEEQAHSRAAATRKLLAHGTKQDARLATTIAAFVRLRCNSKGCLDRDHSTFMTG